MTRRPVSVLAALLGLLAAACGPSDPSGPAESGAPAGSAGLPDVAAAAGVDFVHTDGARGQKYLFETMGSGAAVADFDGDDLPDLLLLQAGTLPPDEFPPADRKDPGHAAGKTSRLYRNLHGESGALRLADVTAGSGLDEALYAHGLAVGDVDADGDRDVFVAAYGRDRLYLNDGTGRFEEAGRAAGVADERWTVGGAFFDADGDGDLDLYVVAYLDMPLDAHRYCTPRPGIRGYCHVDYWDGLDDRLYLNDGKGRFTDASARAGLVGTAGKGLGVAVADFDDDGRPDLFVSNDSMPNLVLRNLGDGRFEDISRFSGADLNAQGRSEACMGVATGDLDGDGDIDLYVTNFEQETNTLYRNDGGGFFTDVSVRSGAGHPSLRMLGFGTTALDVDNDADLDIYVANGHIMDNVEDFEDLSTYAQPDQLFLNDGAGRFTLAEASQGPSLSEPRVGRGLATGDLDRDGDADLVVANVNDGPWVLRNDMAIGHRLVLVLRGPGGRADAEGARVTLESGGRTLVRDIVSGSSYASHGDTELIIGLGDADRVERLSIRWPWGGVSEHGPVAADVRLVIGFGGSDVESRPLAPADAP